MLIEREATLAAMGDVLARARQGRGNILLIAGEAGIGKTSVVSAFVEQYGQDCSVYTGVCDALFTPRPLGPLHDMAINMAGPVAQALEKASTPSPRLFSTLLNFLETSDQPTIMIIEDVHWADHATLDLIKFLGRRVAFMPVLLVLTFRSDEVGLDHPLAPVLGDLPATSRTRLDLEPLSVEGVRELSQGQSALAENIFAVTSGNPFFVTELLNATQSAGGANESANPQGLGAAADSVPVSVRDATNARLNRIEAQDRKFLECLSVVPGPIHGWLLSSLFGEEGHVLAERGLDKHFLILDHQGAYRFRHELARLATMSRVSKSRMKTIHRQVLDSFLLHAGDAHDQIVHHAAGALDVQTVLSYAPQAAERAALAGAHREAASHLGTALRFIDKASPEMAATLYEQWAYEASLALRIDDEVLEARRLATTLWRALGRADKVGENLRWLSRLHWYRGEATQASRFADQAVEVLESTPPSSERAMAYSLRAQLHMLNDRMDEAVEWGTKALELEKKFPNVEVRIHALNNVGTAQLFRDDRSAMPMLEESLRLATEQGMHEHVARLYTNVCEYGVEFRDFPFAEQYINDGLAFATQHDLDAWIHYILGKMAQLRMDEGRLRDAYTIASGVLNLERLTLMMQLPALLVLGRTQLRLGEPSAKPSLADALQDALSTDEMQYIVPARLGLLEAAYMDGDQGAAEEQLDALLQVKPGERHPWNIGEIAVWAKRFNRECPHGFMNDLPEPYQLESKGDYEGAADSWIALGLPGHAAFAYVASQKADNLVKAMAIVEQLDAPGMERMIRRYADESGIGDRLPVAKRGPYKASRNHPLGLTAKEQQVLELITKGASNREISDALSRSQRTIEHHVSSILGKFNASNRMEVLLRVQSEPWLVSPSQGAKSKPKKA